MLPTRLTSRTPTRSQRSSAQELREGLTDLLARLGHRHVTCALEDDEPRTGDFAPNELAERGRQESVPPAPEDERRRHDVGAVRPDVCLEHLPGRAPQRPGPGPQRI